MRPGGGGAPPPSWTGCGPPGLDSFASIFYIFQKKSPWIFRSFRELFILHSSKRSRNDLKLHGTNFWKILKILEEESTSGGPPPVHEGGGRAPCLVGSLELHRPQLQLHIFTFREKDSSCFTIRSRRQALISLGRADLESVWGSGEGDSSPSSSSTILHHQFHDAHRRA